MIPSSPRGIIEALKVLYQDNRDRRCVVAGGHDNQQ